MIKKTSLIIIFAMFFILALAFVSSSEVCCGKVKDGAWCQMADSSECEPDFGMAPTSCEQTTYCKLGTCISENKGTCMQNTPKVLCEHQDGAYWDFHGIDELPMCQNGCCLFGEDAAFVSLTECKQIAYDYGIEIIFQNTVTDEFSCYELAAPNEEGACVFEEDYFSTCRRMTKEECNAVSGGDFNPGYLCTAPQLETNCAPTENTGCYKDKIYFLDSCGNLANIYDETKFTKNEETWNANMRDYWTYIKDPECVVGGVPSNSCGNCDLIEGTICKEYDSSLINVNSPDYGDYVCADMGCYYDTDGDGDEEYYQHGEAWCAESEGVFYHIQVDPNTLEFMSDNFLKQLENQSNYNLPGGRYYKLMCFDGEVIVEPCKDYRNEICMEYLWGENEDFKGAECISNLWRDCLSITNQDSCESEPRFCKWIEGYRFDGTNVRTSDELKSDEQGSCVPLYSPGFDFWAPESTGSEICALATVMEAAVYETNFIGAKRDNFEDQPTCDTNMNNDAVQRCFQNCYVIPDYGRESESKDYMTRDKMVSIHDGNPVEGIFEDYCISDRRGYYCEGSTGEVKGHSPNCADGKKKAKYPIFFTHEEWLDSIRERARSLGDCGYKAGAFVALADVDPELEIVSAIFQKLKQKGSVKEESESEKIYVGDEYLGDIEGYR